MSIPGFGQVILHDSTESEAVSRIFYYRTEDTLTRIESIQHLDFRELDFAHTRSLGFDPAVHWFRFDVTNEARAHDWLLEVAYAPLDRVDFFYRDSLGRWVQQFGGDHFPVSARKYKNRHLVFDLPIERGKTETFFLRIHTTSSIQVPLLIWSPFQFNERNYRDQFSHGIFYGIMLIMIFYNLFLYLSIRDRTTLYYIFTLLSGTNVIAFFQGYGFFYIYPNHPEWGEIFAALSSPLFIVSSVALTRSFLLLRVFSYTLDRILLAVSVVSVLAAAVIIGFGSVLSYTSLHILAVLDFALILLAASYCFYKNYRPARYFLLAWISLLLVGALFSIRNLGFIQGNWFTNNALYFGGIMQTLLISFALGDRINLLKKENEKARQRELDLKHEANERLEEEVRLRTEEIRTQNIQLETNNSIKDKLFSILSHDLKGPLNSLKGTLAIWRMGALTESEMKKVTSDIEEQLHQTSDFLDNLLQWAKSQMIEEVVRPEKVELQKLLADSTELLLPEFKRKNISLHMHISTDSLVYADPTMVRTVIRNLVSNALKFTMPGGYVEITSATENGFMVVSVKDSGVGISAQAMEHIFSLQGVTTSGTREEKGTGIGLVLCKEFISRNGGQIDVQSEEGRGSVFRFTLPSANRQN